MANFESVKMTNPYGIEDTVLKLSIDSEQNSYRLSNLITEPDSYVFVIWHKTNTPCTISINVFGEIITSESNSQWTKVVKVKKVSDVSNKNIDITPPINSTTFFYEAYLSRGTIDTSWSPAPEDIDDNIESVKSEFTQTAEEIKMSAKNIKGDVSNLNIQVGKIEQSVADNKGNISSLTTTIDGINATVKKQGESISSIDQKADKISQQVTSVKSELNSKIELTAGEITQKVDDVRADLSSEIKQTSDKISQTVTDMNNNLSTRINQTAKDIELNAAKTEEIGNSLNNLEIGGRNLLMNTRDFGGNKWILVGTSTPPVYDTDGMYYIGVVDTWSNYAKQTINIDPGEYIISLYAKSSKQAVLEIKDDSSIHNYVIGNITVSSNTWEKYTLSFKNTYATYPFMFTLLTRQNTSTICVKKIKLEKGSKATDWSPAPEDVDEKIDDIQIGGRNILKNSKNGIVCTGTDYSSTTTPGATITTKATGIGNARRFIEDFYTTPVSELSKRVGTEFTFSLDVKITGSFTNLRTKVDFRDTSHNSSIFSNFIGINGLEVGKWTRVSGVASVKGVANVTATRSLFLFDWSNSTVGSTIEYRNLQLEEGNKSTAWTPAPEDIENELTNNYYNKTQMESKLQIQSDNITANVKKEVTTIKNDLDQNYYNKTETDSKFQIQSDSITSTVKKEVTTQIGNIEIGGRNLLLDTRDFGSKSVWVGNRPNPVKDTDGMSYVGVVNTWSKYLKQRIDLLEDIYTLSFYAKASSETTLEVRNDNAPIKIFHTVNVNSVDWKRYLVSVEVDYEHNTELIFFTRAAETIYIKGIKLEKGNKATDWTPAPEDMATADSLADVNNSLTNTTNNLQSNINSTNKNLQDVQNSQKEVYEIISENKIQISSLTQRAEGFQMDFKTVNETVKQLNNQFVTERDERYKYIKFIDGEIWLGKEVPIGEDDFKLVIKNDRISFLQNKTEVAYMSNNKLYVTDIHVTSSLQLGKFVLSSRANGNVGLRWIGN